MYKNADCQKVIDNTPKAKLNRSDSIDLIDQSDNVKKNWKNRMFSFWEKYETSEFEEIWNNAPETNEFKVIFPWNSERKEYNTIDFHPEMAQNMLSYIELEQMMDSLKEVSFYSVQSLIRWQVLLRNFLFLIPILTFALIGFFWYEHIGIYIGQYFNVGFLCLPILVFELVWIALMTKAMRNRFIKLLVKRENRITSILNKWNENFYEPKGLKLGCGYRAAWIELDVNITRNFNDYNVSIEEPTPMPYHLDTIYEDDNE